MRGIEHIPWLYDGFMSIIDGLGFARWRRELIRGAKGRTLEVGCGTGRNLALYGSEVQAIGLDPDFAALARARRRAPEVPLVAGRVEALPFRAEAFDTVVSSLVFCSVDNPLRGLGEIQRVLGREGEFRVLEHVRHERPFWAMLQDRIQPLWTWASGGCRPNRNTEAAVEHAGFHIERNGLKASHVMRCFSARPRA